MSSESPRKHAFAKSVVDIVCILLVITAAKTAIAEPYYVPSGSMEPTLLIGDELVATKYPYGYSTASLPAFMVLPSTKRILGSVPVRGDVVVFRWPGDRSQVWVKRVIGLPGDRIAIRNGELSINGQAVEVRPDGMGQVETEDGSSVPARRFVEVLPGPREHAMFKVYDNGPFDSMPETVVPADHLFVMGDNRDHSADSRFTVKAGGVGMLPVANIIGRADAIVGSWDLGMKSEPVWIWPSGLRFSRFFTAIH
jgi:signal peptidase I